MKASIEFQGLPKLYFIIFESKKRLIKKEMLKQQKYAYFLVYHIQKVRITR